MKSVISTDHAPSAIGPYSQAIQTGQFLFISGQLPIDPETGTFPEGGVKEQTCASLKNLSAILKEAGSGLSHVVKTTVFLKDMSDFNEMNEVYLAFFGPDACPARSAVAVACLPRDAIVEIEAIALVA